MKDFGAVKCMLGNRHILSSAQNTSNAFYVKVMQRTESARSGVVKDLDREVVWSHTLDVPSGAKDNQRQAIWYKVLL